MEWLTAVSSHLAAILLATIVTAVVTWIIAKQKEKRELRRQQDEAFRMVTEAVAKARSQAREDFKKEYRQKYEAALPALARALARLIMEPIVPEKIESHARAIVQTRNEMRRSITSLNDLLNSEIDRLQTILRNAEKEKTDPSDQLLKTMDTLRLSWKDGKIERIEILLRRLFAEAGLSEIVGA
jgi:uncharacterized membrane protein YccC